MATDIGFLIYPKMTVLDFVGPAQVLSQIPDVHIHTIWKTEDPVMTDAQFSVNPSTTFKEAPDLDIICIPGGPGQGAIMDDEEVLNFVARQGAQAKYVTSVCTGSLLLAKAGLLDGYKAGCHWNWRDQLKDYGVEPVAERVVTDRNRITGGGVTAGIDFGLTLAAELVGVDMAKALQLALEYNPTPPFDTGTPEKAGEELTGFVSAVLGENLQI